LACFLLAESALVEVEVDRWMAVVVADQAANTPRNADQ
jgi:hypothetical protein